jgi:hypothetical protein
VQLLTEITKPEVLISSAKRKITLVYNSITKIMNMIFELWRPQDISLRD